MTSLSILHVDDEDDIREVAAFALELDLIEYAGRLYAQAHPAPVQTPTRVAPTSAP